MLFARLIYIYINAGSNSHIVTVFKEPLTPCGPSTSETKPTFDFISCAGITLTLTSFEIGDTNFFATSM